MFIWKANKLNELVYLDSEVCHLNFSLRFESSLLSSEDAIKSIIPIENIDIYHADFTVKMSSFILRSRNVIWISDLIISLNLILTLSFQLRDIKANRNVSRLSRLKFKFRTFLSSREVLVAWFWNSTLYTSLWYMQINLELDRFSSLLKIKFYIKYNNSIKRLKLRALSEEGSFFPSRGRHASMDIWKLFKKLLKKKANRHIWARTNCTCTMNELDGALKKYN